MARTVADAAALLTVLAGVDANDSYTQAGAGKAADYSKFWIRTDYVARDRRGTEILRV